jgi:hypothetical protein
MFSRSQDLEEAYHDAGQFYWGLAQAFLEEVVAFSPASLPVILPRHLVQDIDTLEDWRRAEINHPAASCGVVYSGGFYALHKSNSSGKATSMNWPLIEQKLESLRRCVRRVEEKCPK